MLWQARLLRAQTGVCTNCCNQKKKKKITSLQPRYFAVIIASQPRSTLNFSLLLSFSISSASSYSFSTFSSIMWNVFSLKDVKRQFLLSEIDQTSAVNIRETSNNMWRWLGLSPGWWMCRSAPPHCTKNCPTWMQRFYTVNNSIILYRINCIYLKVANCLCWLYNDFRSVGLELDQPAEIKGKEASRTSLTRPAELSPLKPGDTGS